jgi:hypothetical protein
MFFEPRTRKSARPPVRAIGPGAFFSSKGVAAQTKIARDSQTLVVASVERIVESNRSDVEDASAVGPCGAIQSSRLSRPLINPPIVLAMISSDSLSAIKTCSMVK